jgi:putative IMPACT (imprinted ancient) family translation regulator
MASPFQRYQGGIEASTGNLVQASGQMAAMTANTIAGFGQNLAEGLKTYNENSQKSEAANAKIQMLGQAYADKIAMYSKDPEIAQSGILDSLMAKAKMLQDAPTKGLSQRVMIAHEAETSLAGFGGQLQEWSFLRGREMERNAEEALRKFAGFKSVTQPAFVGDAEFQVDLNLTPQEAQAQALAKLGRIRKSNPNLQGTDEEFLSAWRTAREQALAGAKDVNPSVVSAGLEALAAEKRNAKAQADAQKKNDISGLLSSKFFSTEAPAVGGALNLPKFAQAAGEQPQFLAPVGQTVASMKDYEKTVVSPVDQVNRKNAPQQPQSVSNQGFINGLLERKRILQSRLESDDRIEPSVLPQLAGKASVGVLNKIKTQWSLWQEAERCSAVKRLLPMWQKKLSEMQLEQMDGLRLEWVFRCLVLT